MNQEYNEKISDMVKKAQEPLHAIADLNVKTLQSFDYIKPEEFSKIDNPTNLLEKQLELAISNGHKALDYMQKSFQIMEKTLLSFAQETKEHAKEHAKDHSDTRKK